MAESLAHTGGDPGRLGGLAPVEVAARLRHLEGLIFFDSAGRSSGGISLITASPSRILKGNLADPAGRTRLRTALAEGRGGIASGGLCGWVDYEGDFVFGDYRQMLLFHHAAIGWQEAGELSSRLRETPHQAEVTDFTPVTDREAFLANVRKIKDWIAAGDIYQANVSQAFAARAAGDLFGLYQALREASPAPMAAYLKLGGREILSSSPESFLEISGRIISTHPIKGTRPRFADPELDRISAEELRSSAKEIAELVMITDLLRNDLGQVCEFGSVEVTDMLRLETLAQVHHLVSSVRGTLRPEIDAVEALAACFPGGSITGAPKKRAMEIIRELEGVPRGVYCGAIGWLGFDGSCQFNIAIRTLVRSGTGLIYRTGAGIVADSDPEKEYEETMHKAAGIRLALERWRQRNNQTLE